VRLPPIPILGCRLPQKLCRNCAVSVLWDFTPIRGRGKSNMKLMLVSALVMASVMAVSAQYLAPAAGLGLGPSGVVVIHR
jgi:hypothetical protein